MSLYQHLQKPGPSGFGHGSTAEEVTAGMSLGGKTFLVTGCSSGLGLETMRVLALRGARVLGTARTLEKARAACAAVGGDAVPLACELSDPRSVRACVEAVLARGERLDALIGNAGIMALPRREQAFGVELQLFTNHVGHFLLVTGLLDALADDGRVVMLSSRAHLRAPGRGSGSTTSRGITTTRPGGTTDSPSSPTCSSRRSSRGGSAGRDARRTRSTPA